MNSIVYVGMDVHTTNYTLCCYTIEEDKAFAVVQVEPKYTEILKYIEKIKKQRGEDTQFLCGYEAGCLGYSLYHDLTAHGVKCVILAPSTMASVPGNKVKNDRRDAENISRCLAYRLYKAVRIPDEEDDAVKEYIRMRDDIKEQLKELKQRIIAFYTRHGFVYTKSYWTLIHVEWIEKLQFTNGIYKETLQEYMAEYYHLDEKIAIYDKRIEEFSHTPRYEENVKKLCCLPGIKTHTAMSICVESGDFSCFASAQAYSAYLGLVPGEHSSGNKSHHTGITKAGNCHLRRLLVESAQAYTRGIIGKKSRDLKQRQSGNAPEVIAYANRAAERLKKKFRRINAHANHNVAKTAVARELACFIWGLMTNNVGPVL